MNAFTFLFSTLTLCSGTSGTGTSGTTPLPALSASSGRTFSSWLRSGFPSGWAGFWIHSGSTCSPEPVAGTERVFHSCVSTCCSDMIYNGSPMTRASASQVMLLLNAKYVYNTWYVSRLRVRVIEGKSLVLQVLVLSAWIHWS